MHHVSGRLCRRSSHLSYLVFPEETFKIKLTLQVEGQLRQKDGMGDALHYIDFHQLQIENKQYVSRIEERNDELLKVNFDCCETREYFIVGRWMHLP